MSDLTADLGLILPKNKRKKIKLSTPSLNAVPPATPTTPSLSEPTTSESISAPAVPALNTPVAEEATPLFSSQLAVFPVSPSNESTGLFDTGGCSGIQAEGEMVASLDESASSNVPFVPAVRYSPSHLRFEVVISQLNLLHLFTDSCTFADVSVYVLHVPYTCLASRISLQISVKLPTLLRQSNGYGGSFCSMSSGLNVVRREFTLTSAIQLSTRLD